MLVSHAGLAWSNLVPPSYRMRQRPCHAPQDGASLAVRNVTSMSVITYATSTVATLGPVAMATNEILRQIYILCLQAFTALDIATQALVATYLGKVGVPLISPSG